MSNTPNNLLDLRTGVGQVGSKFVWEVLDMGQRYIGAVKPERTVNLDMNTNGITMRTCSGLRLREKDARELNPLANLLSPVMVLGDGTRWRLGVLAMTDDNTIEGTGQNFLELHLDDLRFILNYPMPHSFGVDDGGSIYAAMLELVQGIGITRHKITPTTATIGGGPVNWPPDATRLSILESLCAKAGYYKPYFDNDGYLVLRPAGALTPDEAHVYTRNNSRLIPGSIVSSSGLLKAYNGYKVISSGPTNGEIYAVAYIDSKLEHSKERRGFEVLKTIRVQGAASLEDCQRIARTHANQDPLRYGGVQMISSPDPRHDIYDVVQWDGALYLEVSWSLQLRPGGDHRHSLVRALVTDV